MDTNISVDSAIKEFLAGHESKNAYKTARVYRGALTKFEELLQDCGVSMNFPVNKLQLDNLTAKFLVLLHDKYLYVVRTFGTEGAVC